MTPEEKLRSDLAALRIERQAAAPPRARRRSRKRVVALLFFGAVAALIGWAAFGRKVPVEVAYAKAASAQEAGPLPVLSGSGYVVTGERYVSIGVRVPGRIDRYFVEEGQSVRKGDALVQIDDRDYRAAVARDEAALAVGRANLELAASELRRGEALERDGIVSQQELDVLHNRADVARASVEQLEAQVEEARINLEYTTLRAPTDGVVLAKLKEVGEIAVPGGFAGSGDLVRIANLSDIRAEVDVNEADLNRVRIGQSAEVTPDAYPDARYPARVVKLYPQVDRQKGTLKVEVQVLEPDEKLLPDMSARVTFLSGTGAGDGENAPSSLSGEKAVLVPAAALRTDERGDTFVWVVTENRARAVTVETGGAAGENVRVTTGLRGGEAVVLGDDVELRDGQKVAVGSES